MVRSLGRFLAVCLLACLCAFAAHAQEPVQVRVLGKEVRWTDARPFIQNGRTMVPLRAVGQAMGLRVDWDNDTQIVTFTKDYTKETAPTPSVTEADWSQLDYIWRIEATMRLGTTEWMVTNHYRIFPVDGGPSETGATGSGDGPFGLDEPLLMRDGRVYAPVRYLADAFRLDTVWDNETRTVSVLAYEQPQVEAVMTWRGGNLVLGLWGQAHVAEMALTELVRYSDTGAESDVPYAVAGEAVRLQMAGAAQGTQEPPMLAVILDEPGVRQDDAPFYGRYRVRIQKTNGAEEVVWRTVSSQP